jgi:hypothetical protein
MSSFAVLDSDGTLVGADEATKSVRESLNAAREARKPFEATWQTNLAFAAGKFWLKWDRDQRRLVTPSDYYGKELYSADVITEYRTTALGELGSDDDRPELLLRRDDKASEDFQAQLNRAVGWGWDYEWMGDDVLEEVRRLCVDMGTAAVRCRWNPDVGPVVGELPHVNGLPVHGLEEQTKLADQFGDGPIPGVQMKSVQRGAVHWDVLSAFNLLVPSGIPHERDFPWEGVIRPVLLSSAQGEFGAAMGDLKEDSDIGSVLGLDAQSEVGDSTSAMGSTNDGKTQRLRGYVWLTTYYERPTRKYPKGRTIVFAGNKMKPVRITDRLPYERPDGTPSSGIAYFHWWRVTGRFWSRALVESMKDPQRSVNKRRTQINEIIDRGLPAIFVARNSKAKERRGLANELIEIGEQERSPTIFPGVSPGEWMYHDIQEAREDLEHATGIRGPRLGENPANVTTYAQLALLNENDQTKRQSILREHKLSIARLVEFSIYDMRTYWGEDRQLEIAGDDDQVEAHEFNATRIPPFFIVKVAKGSAKPRSQAAELKKIEELWQAAETSGAAVQNPSEWIQWLYESLELGEALELPHSGASMHEDKAERENHHLLTGDAPAHVQYYDPHEVHILIHREAEIEAELSDDLEAWQRIEDHIQQHVLTEQMVAMHQAQMESGGPTQGMPGAPPGAPGLPPGVDPNMPPPMPGDVPQEAGPPGTGAPGPSGPAGPADQAPAQGNMQIHVPPTSVQVAPAQVNVAAQPPPDVHVHVPPSGSNRHVTFERDKQGRITAAHVKDTKAKK